jgi:hypothetical protein
MTPHACRSQSDAFTEVISDRVEPPANSTPVRHALLAEVMSVLVGAHALIPRDFDFVSDLVTFDIVGAWEPAKEESVALVML